jgi:hypothetical protein
MTAAPLATAAIFAVEGYVYQEITTEVWYVTGVLKTLQSEVASYVSAVESVHDRYVQDGVAVTTAPGGAMPTRVVQGGALKTQVPIMVGVGGVGAAVVAML